MTYNPNEIEPKWQQHWEQHGFYRAEDFSKKPKFYVLIEFPYLSGEGLHVGHCRSYSALDAVARKKRMEGYNVLYPIGWDAFGLPAENYAIRTGVHPRQVTDENIKTFKKQLKSLGLSFDWSREIDTSDPNYYKWTQWIFLQLFKKNLAYRAKIPINWCPSCKIGLAHEEVIDGKCERCGAEVEQREIKQWLLRLTKYADRLIEDLKQVDYLEKIKTQQINWIGKSYGTEIDFGVVDFLDTIKVFTTRVDTIFGVTAIVLAPEHPLVEKLVIKNYEEKVEEYIRESKKKSEFERTKIEKEKTGVFTGAYCVNPVNSEKVPIWIGDYVVATYGGGAVMVVPAHDKRDYDFAVKYNLPVRQVISPINADKDADLRGLKEAFVDYGVLINSGQFNGLSSQEAMRKITEWLEKKKLGRKTIQYKLRDWVFSRQHYWGEPIPIIHCQSCGTVPVPEKDLPVELPYVERYQPTGTGESPLADISDWVNVACPSCGGAARRETDTMPNWAGSNWYYMRYCDPNNDEALADKKKLKYWMPVDWYNGGFEHTTLHLLYSRFWYKFLYDIGVAPNPEPYKKRTSHGIVLAEDGRKMSKSFGNVVNPDDIVKTYGADTLRIYEMFMGPFDQGISWNTQGVKGVFRFLERVWRLNSKIKSQKSKLQLKNQKLERLIHKTIKKIDEDLENTKFNTAVSALMILVNEMEKEQAIPITYYQSLLILLSPFAPHITEELWHQLGHEDSIHNQVWPKYDSKLVKEETITLIVQINGKVRDKIEVEADISEEKAKKLTLEREKVKKWIEGKETKKIVFVPGKLINIVV
ncbi:MAG: leucine--tRNA ligase [Candidatus Nealsonbacteria bacterium CG23_combo_of_CG06-09_8_20_14_all_36_12]|uniref:Leucine--tRNA ligase n=2 Tax=Candidatus Nealsoniibacteriota TaxID=1817911 RepID=A0A2G9Z2I0_9BACT|nr:MAG: leucine--tRNA ligase [Candidatus Nealsonbacteria bacterium CG23_combo_of_CG06-09_8_20_14_all_36_12]